MLILAKKFWKIEIELFWYGAISQKNFSLSEIFWRGLPPQTVYCFQSPPGHFKFDLFHNFGNSKGFNTVLT